MRVLRGPDLGGYLNKPKSLQESIAVEEQDIGKYFNAIKGAMDAYVKHHGLVEEQHLSQNLLKKLEKISKEQDSDMMSAIESLPEKEKALAQFIFGLPFFKHY